CAQRSSAASPVRARVCERAPRSLRALARFVGLGSLYGKAQGNGPYPPQMLFSSCCPDRPNVPWAAAYFDLLDDFFLGMRAPDLRASLSATATACLRLVTFLPLPDFRLPSL